MVTAHQEPQAQPELITQLQAAKLLTPEHGKSPQLFLEEPAAAQQPPAPPVPTERSPAVEPTKETHTVQDDIDEDLLPVFLEEGSNLYLQLGNTLRAWRAQPDDEGLSHNLQRTLHTLKGGARMVGAIRMGALTHHMEEHVIQTGVQHDAAFWSELDNYFDRIGSALDRLRSGAPAKTGMATKLMANRMVPFSSIGDRLYRIVRQTGRELGKNANLKLVGSELDLDRNMLEKMTAPFEHLLRNAMVHGLESAEERIRKGKSPTGSIRLTLRQENNEVEFEFTDDGAGLDIEHLRSKAIERSLLQTDTGVGESEIMQLIFSSGLSTASEVTEISGRGVGMDVVRSEINALGGYIDVFSERDKGARFVIHLPLAATDCQSGLCIGGELAANG